MNDYVFALDIGTQSVTGIILEERNSKYEVIDYYIEQHKERSMLDGQIHNVVAVSEVITKVKNKLEQTYGPLHDVAVAAAGRALKTVQATKEKNISTYPLHDHDEVKHLELAAVQKAQRKLIKEKNKNSHADYHCVGYSVLHYKLDDEVIGSLIDQTGTKVSVEIIATFLPKIVIDSLLAALERANLNMSALTLEPIAAIHVLIPDSMRRLNVALVDVGAGTSDIAITSDGTVTAYGMVPTAGDLITETMSDEFLLDFKVAERAKQAIVNNGEAKVDDILGFETTITHHELVDKTKQSVEKLASLITTEILNLNGKAPKAIMLIGGGSLTPRLKEEIANSLNLSQNRVAIRDVEAVELLHKNNILPQGPDFVTPVGIAITAKQNPINYVNITVNDESIRMFEINNLTVGDCLIQAGIDLQRYYGRPGLALIVFLNDEKISIPGKYGEKPFIYVNGIKEDVDTRVQHGDTIKVEKGSDGLNPEITVRELVGELKPINFTFNNKNAQLKPTIKVNDQHVKDDYIIQDNDNIIVHMPETIHDFLKNKQINDESIETSFFVFVNNKKIDLDEGRVDVFINNKPAKLTDFIQENDHITLKLPNDVTVKTLLNHLQLTFYESIDVLFNGELITLKRKKIDVIRNNEYLDLITPLTHKDEITIRKRKVKPFIFQDIFRYVDLEEQIARNRRYELYKNGEKTTFFEQIQAGDELKIVWES